MESSQASLASLNLTGSKAYSDNEDSEEKKGQQGYGETSGCKPREGIRKEWLNLAVSYSDIKNVTENFSETLVIGKGGFGKVYLAKLRGRMVAIKMLDSKSTQGEREFFQEVEVLHKMQHPNLVRLVGACFEEEARALVYQYLPNGSLEDRLTDKPNILTWQMRTRIIYEICSALSYLHSKSVIHADLKPANVLLDANFNSKLSDFGLCRLLPEDMVTAKFLETSPIGTLGYIDPWFLERCILRPGSDLYSLGITVLKLLTGMSPVGLGWKIRHITDENLLRKMIDPTVENWPFALAMKLIHWSIRCCFHNEDSIGVLKGMSSCLEVMLAGIDTPQEPEQTMGFGSGLAPPSHNKDKEVIGEPNPPSSSSSFSKVDRPRGNGRKRSVQLGGSFLSGLLLGPVTVYFNVPAIEGASSTYGKLYEAKSRDGSLAVKRLNDNILVNEKQFKSQLKSIQSISHSNLLHLRGYYYDPTPKGEKLLVFGSVPNGGRSLATFLHAGGQARTDRNNWQTRMKIAYGISKGLEYLHKYPIIIHGNLTSTNIILDEKKNAKISDYELSRLLTEKAFSGVTAAANALGYRQYPNSQQVADTKSTDVYSFGVILLEILTGKTPGEMSTSGSDLQQWLKSFPDGKWPLDPELLSDDQVNDVNVSKAFKLAMDCVDYSPQNRPMTSVLSSLLPVEKKDNSSIFFVLLILALLCLVKKM